LATISRLIDRWIYVFTAALYIATVLAGFVPDSLEMLGEIKVGQHPPLTLIYHVHAVTMGTWMLLFLVQTLLMANGRRELHKRVGLAAVALAPLVVGTMIGMVFMRWRWFYSTGAAALAARDWAVVEMHMANILIEQIHAVIVFPLLVGWALLVRRTDPESHKRFMVQATLPALFAAIDRIEWLPTTMPGSVASWYGYMLLLLAPVLTNDLVQRRRLHSAYVIGLCLMLAAFAANHFLWNSPGWLAAAQKLMGVSH
jgi:uncharacterized membrane protein YozB (DUF420 family)